MLHAPDHRTASIRHGFTLLEVMIALGILGTVMALLAQSMLNASSSASTLTTVSDLQSDAAYALDRIQRDLRGARLPTPPALNTWATSISFQPVPSFTSTLDEANLFATADTITVANPSTTPGSLTRNLNDVSDETLNSNVSTTFPVSSQTLGMTAGLTLPGFFVYRTSSKSLRLYLALAGTDHTGNTLQRYAMIEVPTNN